MALPTQEIEKIVRGPAAAQGTYKQLLVLSGSLLVISFVLYFGLTLGYEPYLQGQVANFDSQIQQFAKQVPAEDQAKLVSFYSQLVNLKTLLNRHPSTLNLFTWLEKNTQANTYFTKFSFNGTTYQFSLAGVSKTTDDVAMQAAILESQPEVLRMNLNNLSPAEGGSGWQFNINVFVSPKALGVTGVAMPVATSTPAAPAIATTTPAAPVSTTTPPAAPAKPLSGPPGSTTTAQ